MDTWIAIIFLFLLGISIGSFLNVLIYRVPRKKSLVSPPSHCPNCHTPLKWYDNLPILSFILLRGRCRNCRQRIPLRYPLVELFSGLLFVAVLLKIIHNSSFSLNYRLVTELVNGLFFVSVLLAIAYIDSEHQIIPNRIIYPSLIAGPILLVIANPHKIGLYLIGFALGAGLLLLISLVKPAGMGAGDIKLAAFMGLFLGWQVLLALFIGFATGAIVGVALALLKKKGLKEPIAFGPFLAMGSIITYFYGTPLINLYLGTFTR